MIMLTDMWAVLPEHQKNRWKWFGDEEFEESVHVNGLFFFFKNDVNGVLCVFWLGIFFYPVCSAMLSVLLYIKGKPVCEMLQPTKHYIWTTWLMNNNYNSNSLVKMEVISLPTQPLNCSYLCGILVLTDNMHVHVGCWCKTDCCKVNEVGAKCENKALS